MAGLITRGTNPKLMWPGLDDIYGLKYGEWDNGAQWRRIFPVSQSEKEYEEDVGMTGMGLVPVKAEGSDTEYDTMKQNFVSQYRHDTYALGYIVSMEEQQDNQYKQVGEQRASNLAFVMTNTKENVAMLIFNRAFNAAYPGGDAVSLLNASHPLASGTFSNIPSFPVNLSEASLEQATIDIQGAVDARGVRIPVRPDSLIIPRQLQFKATRILKNATERPATANRDINAMYIMNTYPGGIIVNQYLDDPNAWFVKTTCPVGLKCYQRMAMKFTEDNAFDSKNAKFQAMERYRFGWTDPRGLYGSQGA